MRYSPFIPEQAILTSGIVDAEDVLKLAQQARSYLEFHTWCHEVTDVSFGHGFAHVGVFFCHANTSDRVRSEFFVVVGDVPPLYFDLEDSPTPVAALQDYVAWMVDLCDAFEAGQSLEEFPPLRARGDWAILAPSPELVNALRSRMKFVERELILPYVALDSLPPRISAFD